MEYNETLQKLLHSLEQFVIQQNEPECDYVGVIVYHQNSNTEKMIDMGTSQTFDFNVSSGELTLVLDNREINLCEIDNVDIRYVDEDKIHEIIISYCNDTVSIHLIHMPYEE